MKYKLQAFLITIISVFTVSTAAVLWSPQKVKMATVRVPLKAPAPQAVTVIKEPPLDLSSPYNLFARDVALAKQSNSSTISLQFFGDIMLDRNVAKNMGSQGLDYIFDKVICHPEQSEGSLSQPPKDSSVSLGMTDEKECDTKMFGATDILMANLEGSFAPTRIKTSKSIAFRFDSKLVDQLKAYGFHGFSLANNHSYDMGRSNVAFTRETLKKVGLGYFGDELKEGSELTWTQNDVAFIGLHNTYHEPDLKKVEQTLIDAKSKARYVIINVHWGEEYKRISNKKQRDLAHWLIDHGATVVIGHHPHVVEEMEIYKGAPIFYSLGNFIFDQYFSKETQEGLSVGITLQNGHVKSIYLFPFFGVKSQVQLMMGERRDEFLQWMEESSRLAGNKIENGEIKIKD